MSSREGRVSARLSRYRRLQRRSLLRTDSGRTPLAAGTDLHVRFCSLMGQGRRLGDERYRRCRVSAFSACSLWHLMGSAGCRVARLKPQSAILAACYKSAPSSAPSLGRRSARELGSTSCPVDAARYAGLNSVPWRNMACMRMARRRASAIRALRIVDRLAIANAQSFSFSGPL